MRHCFVVLMMGGLALPCAARAQDRPGGALQAFGSDRALARYFERMDAEGRRRTPPPPPAAPAPAPAAAPAAPAPPPPACAAASEPLPPFVSAQPVRTGAQGPAVVYGRVVGVHGCPEPGVLVRIEALNVAATTAADGSYRLVVPAARFAEGTSAVLAAHRAGLVPARRTVVLRHGQAAAEDVQVSHESIALEDVVVTGLQGKVSGVSITNTQHAGVDEGGIVKLHGDHLVVLRRGRLFTVRIQGGALEPVDAVDAFAPGAEPGDWYDEMLVSGDNVVVIGYSYSGDGTEIGLFGIDARGRLRHRSTYHMRSDDYYSARNYASRLLGSRLVMYTPVPVDRSEADLSQWMPGLRRWRRGGDDAAEPRFARILPASRIFRPHVLPGADDYLVLHTVTTCDIARGELECTASAVLGPEGRVFYVSPRAVYVWVTEDTPGADGRQPSTLYRMPLDGGRPQALGVEGTPVDQFSFLESEDGHLNVVVRSDGRGDGMWASGRAAGGVRLLRVPLGRFGDGRSAAPRSAYRALPQPGRGGEFHNRFVGHHLLYGSGAGWDPPRPGASTLTAVRWRTGAATELPLPHGVDRIEAMGGDAVVVGSDSADLHFSGIRLGGTPRVAQHLVRPGTWQGETRSHGFFYRQDGPGEGIIGLPVVGGARPGYEQLFDESASVLFVRNSDERFRDMGELVSQTESNAEDADGCVASCMDWYGNSRPIFLDGRVFALLGYEIVEGAVEEGRIREVARASFAPERQGIGNRE